MLPSPTAPRPEPRPLQLLAQNISGFEVLGAIIKAEDVAEVGSHCCSGHSWSLPSSPQVCLNTKRQWYWYRAVRVEL